jgi:hypothetical protein
MRAIVTDLICCWQTNRPETWMRPQRDVLTLLATLSRDYGKTIVMVTHSPHAVPLPTVRHLEKACFAGDVRAVRVG